MNWMTMKSFTSTMPCIPSTIPDRIMAGFCKGKPIAIGFESPTNPGRKRVNINGSLNAHDVTDVIVREDETINAQSTVKLWEAQKAKHSGKTNFIPSTRERQCTLLPL